MALRWMFGPASRLAMKRCSRCALASLARVATRAADNARRVLRALIMFVCKEHSGIAFWLLSQPKHLLVLERSARVKETATKRGTKTVDGH